MAFAIRQNTGSVRKRGSNDVVEPDRRLLFAAMAIGIAAGAILTPSNGDSKVAEPTKLASAQK